VHLSYYRRYTTTFYLDPDTRLSEAVITGTIYLEMPEYFILPQLIEEDVEVF
jgi:hypothetical protein